MLETEPSEFPDEQFHTLTIEQEDDGDFHIAASNNDTHCIGTVGSVAIEGVGVNRGEVTLNAASSVIELTYKDFTAEYGYDEIKVTFEDRERKA